ncbi:hypothetical protein HO173_010235 [Letharia columbiana]|uniref:Uncharacterized protein n=1 Tax=Letharia columbiana TaxID=112416 RepID=A0A8H6L114_9LECA|nr:uncharacterized protein HO173_010235 [Letharia columbiana]KAF6231483.1 hypothetical protein HO173_010235 [Letharia columbiana]
MPERLQIIWTPWRNHSELLSVREWFFPQPASSEQADSDSNSRKKACNHVSAWKLRGNLPHAVESTCLLTEAVLIDEKSIEQTPAFAIRASYITAISRFVTGLLDSQQESKYKVSMYTQAQKIGLPALFVDIRHEATHGDMPNLTNLRSAAQRALTWLWEDYWKGLEEQAPALPASHGPTAALPDEAGYQREKVEGDGEEQPGGWQKWQGRWTPKPIGTV